MKWMDGTEELEERAKGNQVDCTAILHLMYKYWSNDKNRRRK
jgi:hypothetical protein